MKDATLKKNRKLLKKGGVVIFASAILIGASQIAFAENNVKNIDYDPCEKVIKAREEAREAWRQEYVSNYKKTVGQSVSGEIDSMTSCTVNIMEAITNIKTVISSIMAFSGSISATAIVGLVEDFINELVNQIINKACKIIDNTNDKINGAIDKKFNGFLDQFTYKEDLPYDLGTVGYDPRTGFSTSGIVSGDKGAINRKAGDVADDILDPFKTTLEKSLPLGAR